MLPVVHCHASQTKRKRVRPSKPSAQNQSFAVQRLLFIQVRFSAVRGGVAERDHASKEVLYPLWCV